MCGPAATLSARSFSPRGGMRNTCGRPATFFLSFAEQTSGFCGALPHPGSGEE
jgi:hypothetical protein